LFKQSPWIINEHTLRGHSVIYMLNIAKTFKHIFLMDRWPECININGTDRCLFI